MAKHSRTLILAALAGAAALAPAQDLPKQAESPKAPEAGGIAAIDLLILKEGALGAPLRYGSVVPGSEAVDLNGRSLAREREYSIDEATGVVYLKIPFNEGDRLRVTYRRMAGKGEAGEFGQALAAGAPSFTLNIAEGAKAVIGMGLTERLGEGESYTSQVYGLKNDFEVGNGLSLRGGYFSGQRSRVQSIGLMGEGAKQSRLEEGDSRAFVQTLSGGLFGGKVRLYRQDVDQRFGGFSSMQAAGFSADDAGRLRREAGLKRSELQIADLPAGPFSLSFANSEIEDTEGSIHQRGYGAKGAGWQADWSQVTIDESFGRFQDVGGQAWKQLQNERGSKRESLSAQASLFGGKAKYQQLSIVPGGQDAAGRTSLGFEGGGVKLDWNRQDVGEGFKSFQTLRGEEFDLREIRDEAGVVREGLGFSAASALGAKLSLNTQSFRHEGSKISSFSASAERDGLRLSASQQSVDEGFRSFGQLGGSGGAQTQAMLNITTGGAQANGHDHGGLSRQAGMERTRIDFAAGDRVQAARAEINDGEGALIRDAFALRSGRAQFRFNQQRADSGFKSSSRLLNSEQALLGSVDGLQKSDGAVSMPGIEISWMDAAAGEGDAARRLFQVDQKGLKASYAHRSVSDDFEAVNGMADPEQAALRALRGWSRSEGSFSWSPISSLQMEGEMMGSERELSGEDARMLRGGFQWQVSQGTRVKVSTFQRSHLQDGEDQDSERIHSLSIQQKVGPGTLTVGQVVASFDGEQAKSPDLRTNSVAFEAQVAKGTTVKTEQSETQFATGARESVNSNTIQHQLTPRTGVSVSETMVQRAGTEQDQTLRSYGVSHDFGGIKLAYNHVRHLNPGDSDTLNTQFSISEGQAQGMTFGGSYDRQRWDDQRHRHQGGFTFGTSAPVDLLFLQDVSFNLRFNSLRDRYSWNQEDKSGRLEAAVGQVGLGFDYLSQIAPGQQRAVDRFYTFKLDRQGKGALQANLRYGVRTLPNDDHTMVRDYAFSFKPAAEFSIEHALTTNALKAQNNVLLGSVATPLSTNRWALGWSGLRGAQMKVFWQESLDEARNQLLRQAGLDLSLFQSSGSPVLVTYAFSQKDQGGSREGKHTFGFGFVQKPGPNQSLAMQLQNYSWEHGGPQDFQRWSLRMDYSVRF